MKTLLIIVLVIKASVTYYNGNDYNPACLNNLAIKLKWNICILQKFIISDNKILTVWIGNIMDKSSKRIEKSILAVTRPIRLLTCSLLDTLVDARCSLKSLQFWPVFEHKYSSWTWNKFQKSIKNSKNNLYIVHNGVANYAAVRYLRLRGISNLSRSSTFACLPLTPRSKLWFEWMLFCDKNNVLGEGRPYSERPWTKLNYAYILNHFVQDLQ